VRQQSSSSKVFRFGAYEAHVSEGTLTRNGIRIRLQEQPFRILTLLLENPGQLVTREEIRAVLWPADTFVEFDDVLNTSVRKLRSALNDSADNPRFLETVPRRGYRFVAPVTVVELGSTSGIPASAVNSAGDDLSGLTDASNGYSYGRVRYWIAAALILSLVGGAVYTFRALRPHSAKAGGLNPSTVTARRSVAVIGFRNLPGRPQEDWLGAALNEMLSTELAAGGSLRIVSEEDVARAKRDLRIADVDSLSQATLESLRVNSGADIVVVGSYTAVEEKDQKRIRLDVRMQDTASGETISREAFSGTEGSLFEVATQAGTKLRGQLGAQALTAEAANQVQASLPSNGEALRLYAESRAKIVNLDYPGARDLLVKAAAAEPGSAAVHGALADCWAALGYTATAQEEAKRGLDLSSSLSREEQLSFEGRYRQLGHDWPKAAETYRALTRFFPDNLDYGLRLAAVLSKDGKEQESLQAIEALRRLPKPIADDPRIDLQEALTFSAAGDYKGMKTAAVNAAGKAQKRGTRMLLAEAKLLQSQAATRQDDPKDALALDEEAQAILEQAGDRYGVARARYRMGDILWHQGKFAESNAILEQALRDFRATGNQAYTAWTLNDIAVGLMDMGDLSQAKSMYEQALVAQHLVRNKRGVADTLTNLGSLVWRAGDLAGAKKYYEEALTVYQEIEEKDATAFMKMNIGNVLVDQGDLARGRNLLDESLAYQRKSGSASEVAEALHNLANVLSHQGDVAGAEKDYDEALAIQTGQGEESNAAQTRLDQANLLLDTGKPADSEPLARSALQQYKKEKQVGEEASAHDTLARTLLELGRLPEAKIEIALATRLASQYESASLRLRTTTVTAQVLAAEGQPEAAARKLHATIQETRQRGFFILRMQAMLALAQVEAKSGKKTEARTLFQSVEKDARSKGFLVVARKAATLGPL
jgi:DNA-binding winged helix-turn-helix (wHTH) protein/tetratricopeptide (TPR) repeat protein